MGGCVHWGYYSSRFCWDAAHSYVIEAGLLECCSSWKGRERCPGGAEVTHISSADSSLARSYCRTTATRNPCWHVSVFLYTYHMCEFLKIKIRLHRISCFATGFSHFTAVMNISRDKRSICASFQQLYSTSLYGEAKIHWPQKPLFWDMSVLSAFHCYM